MSFDHLRRAQQDRARQLEPERLGGLQVDDEVDLGRLRDWQIGGLCALEDFVNEGCVVARHAPLVHKILNGLKDRPMQPELVKVFIAEFHAEINRQRDGHDQERALKQRELEQVRRKHNGLIDAIADGLRTTGLKAKLEALEEQKARLEAALLETPPPAPRLHPNLAGVYRRKVADLHGALADHQTHDQAFDILRSLIDKVIMHPREDGFEVELVGEIAQMVAFGNQRNAKKKIASIDEAACSV